MALGRTPRPSTESRFRLYDRVSAFLRRVSEAQSTLVVLDDLEVSLLEEA